MYTFYTYATQVFLIRQTTNRKRLVSENHHPMNSTSIFCPWRLKLIAAGYLIENLLQKKWKILYTVSIVHIHTEIRGLRAIKSRKQVRIFFFCGGRCSTHACISEFWKFIQVDVSGQLKMRLILRLFLVRRAFWVHLSFYGTREAWLSIL